MRPGNWFWSIYLEKSWPLLSLKIRWYRGFSLILQCTSKRLWFGWVPGQRVASTIFLPQTAEKRQSIWSTPLIPLLYRWMGCGCVACPGKFILLPPSYLMDKNIAQKKLLATDTKRVVTSSHLYYYSHTSGHLTVNRTFLCQLFNPWNLASTLSLHVNHQIKTLSKKKMFGSTVIALQCSPVFCVFKACWYSTCKIDRWRNDDVSCTKRFSRPFLDPNLCEQSGSDMLGSLQNKLGLIISEEPMGLLQGWRILCEGYHGNKTLQLLWIT